MPTASDFLPAALQASIFTPDADLSNRTVLALLAKGAQALDAEPQLFPKELPREIPRAIMQSSNGTWRCEIGAARVNMHWRTTQSGATSIPNDVWSTIIRFFKDYLEIAGSPKIDRLAVVLTSYCPAESPGISLARHFCQERWWERPLNRPENFELHAHKVFTLAGYSVNSWFRSKTGVLNPAGPDQPVAGQAVKMPIILIEQDINTVIDSTKAFVGADVEGFITAAAGEFPNILSQYYPSEKGSR